jgi:hypothetical protein
MASQPILVLIPGSFSWSHQYDALVQPLRAKGHVVHVLEPPCYPAGYKANAENPLPNMYDDAKFINEFVSKLVDEEKEVVLLAHSYGGMSKPSTGLSFRFQHEDFWISEILGSNERTWLTFGHGIGCPASESLKGVTKKEREQQGKKGGVVRIAYLTAVVPCLGESVGQTIKGGKGISIDIGEVCQTTISSRLRHSHFALPFIHTFRCSEANISKRTAGCPSPTRPPQRR